MSNVDWCKVYERLEIKLKEKLDTSKTKTKRLISKTNNIHDTQNEVLRFS